MEGERGGIEGGGGREERGRVEGGGGKEEWGRGRGKIAHNRPTLC